MDEDWKYYRIEAEEGRYWSGDWAMGSLKHTVETRKGQLIVDVFGEPNPRATIPTTMVVSCMSYFKDLGPGTSRLVGLISPIRNRVYIPEDHAQMKRLVNELFEF